MSPRPELAPLRQVAEDVAADWGLELGPPFPLSRFAYVAPAGHDTVLKVTSPDDDESDEEADALGLWAGEGAVRLLRRDVGHRALLLQRARPGTDLAALPDDEATAIAVDVGLRLWRPAGAPFRRVGDHVPRWLANAERAGASPALVRVASRLYAALEPGSSTLVHGDLHHHNLLDAGGRYLAIDPKPMLGEPEFDVPTYLWNPLSCRMRRDVTERRIAAFAAAGLDERRIRAWAVIRGAYLRSDPRELELLRALIP
ncbi:MAG: aminoglycoside phosphotransferase family protein [Thermoleophilia bacterium]|nr:aminoglycoside phosphotransferase family protein [Thermoleophilia bacterium]